MSQVVEMSEAGRPLKLGLLIWPLVLLAVVSIATGICT
jgi:hypothetical protein